MTDTIDTNTIICEQNTNKIYYSYVSNWIICLNIQY